jgi:hypothetical protein
MRLRLGRLVTTRIGLHSGYFAPMFCLVYGFSAHHHLSVPPRHGDGWDERHRCGTDRRDIHRNEVRATGAAALAKT